MIALSVQLPQIVVYFNQASGILPSKLSGTLMLFILLVSVVTMHICPHVVICAFALTDTIPRLVQFSVSAF